MHSGKKESEASRAVVWGGGGGGEGGRMAEAGDKSLMPLIRPPAINLSLKFQHVNVISDLFCLCNKQYLTGTAEQGEKWQG